MSSASYRLTDPGFKLASRREVATRSNVLCILMALTAARDCKSSASRASPGLGSRSLRVLKAEVDAVLVGAARFS